MYIIYIVIATLTALTNRSFKDMVYAPSIDTKKSVVKTRFITKEESKPTKAV